MAGEMTYDDFLKRINIQEVLLDAGYHLNRRDGLRYPSYVRLDSNGQRIRGDKFIVTRKGQYCFQPPYQRNYNVIGFIKEHPQLFREYHPGMSTDRLVNLVCNRLLNNPVELRERKIYEPEKEIRPFRAEDYSIHRFSPVSRESQKKFYNHFKSRGIDLSTQYAFHKYFFLATKEAKDGRKFTNLSFPLTIPDTDGTVGLEERSRPKADGSFAYKGKAAGSNSSQGLWIANLSNKPLEKAERVLWFESAFDAMAYYQLHKKEGKETKGVYISTGGHPTERQIKGMLAATDKGTEHRLCFDNDGAGRMFAIYFALLKEGRDCSTRLAEMGELVVHDRSGEQQQVRIDMEPFDFERIAGQLDLKSVVTSDSKELAGYLESLHNPGDIYSGDADFLPKPLLKLYGTYEVLAEEYHSSLYSGLVCQEELEEQGKELVEASQRYKSALEKSVRELEQRTIVYDAPNGMYKDWNDQLLDKRLCVQADEAKTVWEDQGKEVVIQQQEECEERIENEDGQKQGRFRR